jgi:hypothetical protein
MDGTLIAEGFDTAIIGIENNGSVPRVVYSIPKIVKILMSHPHDMGYLDAVEYVQHNMISAYMGEGSPLYVDTMPYDDALNSIEH